MKKELEFLKAAAGHFPQVSILNCYVIHDGYMYCGNGAIAAGIPYQSSADFNIPTEELEVAVARMKGDPVLERRATANGSTAVLRNGRLRSTILCLDDDPPAQPDLTEDFEPVPPDFCRALELALPFVSKEGTWQTGIYVSGPRVVAINGRSGIEFLMEEGDFPTLLLTQDCAKFVAEHKPDEYQASDNNIVFRWEDGRWLRAQFLAYEMPKTIVDSVFNKAGTDAPIAISSEWREAYDDISAIAADIVELQTDRMIGRRNASVTEVAIKSGVPAGHVSTWKPEVLDPVVAIATHWNPMAHPQPALFKGEGFRGVVLGVKA